MTDELQREWFSTGEVATHLGIGPSTVYRLVKAGKLAAYKIGSSRRFRRADVEALPERIGAKDEQDEG